MNHQQPSLRKVRFRVSSHQAGIGLVDAIVAQLRSVSRTRVHRLIAEGNVRVNSHRVPPDWRLAAGDMVELSVPPAWLSAGGTRPVLLRKDDILFEDQHLLAVNKPAGVSVLSERSPGTTSLFEALLAHVRLSPLTGGQTRPSVEPGVNPERSQRENDPTGPSNMCGDQKDEMAVEPLSADAGWYPHISHRLDKETSGVMIICKTREAHKHLAGQFESRKIEKEYFAIVHGVPPHDRGRIDFPIAEHPKEPGKMLAVRTSLRRAASGGAAGSAKPAITDFEVAERFARFASVRLRPLTGRTHQVRVHLAAIGHPVVGDRLYGNGEPVLLSRMKANYKHKKFEAERPLISRLALHATRIAFDHPVGGGRVEVVAPLPRDMEILLRALRKYGK